MKRHARRHLVVFAFLSRVLCAGAAAARTAAFTQSRSASRLFEVWGAFHVTFGTDAGRLDSTYVPQVGSASDVEGRASQVLALEPAMGRGGEFGVNLFPARTWGSRRLWPLRALTLAAQLSLRDRPALRQPAPARLQGDTRPRESVRSRGQTPPAACGSGRSEWGRPCAGEGPARRSWRAAASPGCE